MSAVFSIVAALAILITTAVVGAICIALLRDSSKGPAVNDRSGEKVVRSVRSCGGNIREFYASDVPPDSNDRAMASGRGAGAGEAPEFETPGCQTSEPNSPDDVDRPPMFPGLITLRRVINRVLDRGRNAAVRAGLPVPSMGSPRRHGMPVQGQIVSLAGTMVEPWDDAVYRLGIEYPLEDRHLVRRAVETVQIAWGRMAGDEPRMTPMAQRIAITGLLSDDHCRAALGTDHGARPGSGRPAATPDEWLVDRAARLLARQVMVPGAGARQRHAR